MDGGRVEGMEEVGWMAERGRLGCGRECGTSERRKESSCE